MDELQHPLVLFVAKVSPTVPVAISGVDGTPPDRSYAAVLDVSLGGLIPSLMEAQAPVEVCSEQGRSFPLGGGASLLEALRNMVKKFFAKVRADMVRVFFFRVGPFFFKASTGIRKRLYVGRKLKFFSAYGPCLRPRPLNVVLRVRAFTGVDGVSSSESELGEACSEKKKRKELGEASSEKAHEAILGDTLDFSGDAVVPGPKAGVDAAVSTSSPAMGLLRRSGDAVVSGPVTVPVAAVFATPTGKIALRLGVGARVG